MTSNPQESVNAITVEMGREIAAAVAEVNLGVAVRVIVASGAAGRSAPATTSRCTPRAAPVIRARCGTRSATTGRQCGRTPTTSSPLWWSPKPTIALIQWHYVSAGGSDIALSCDLIVHGRGRAHRLHAREGLGMPDDCDVGVPTRGRARKAGMLLTGGTIDGSRPASWGFFFDAVPVEELDEAVPSGSPDACGERADQPALADAEADGQPGTRQHGSPDHADDRDALRRHHEALPGGPDDRPVARVRRGRPVARTRPGHPR